MATTVTETNELQLELSNAAGDITRTIRIENPDTETYATKADVEAVISSALFPATTQDGTVKTGFFCDDANPEVPLTMLKSVSHVIITKSVNQYA